MLPRATSAPLEKSEIAVECLVGAEGRPARRLS
jgi:hypothetical protein